MTSDFSALLHTVFTVAQTSDQTFQATEYDLPETTAGILLTVIGLTVLFGLACRTSLRDSRFLSRPWRGALLTLRVVVLLLLIVVLVNPRNRTQLSRVDRSRVGILVDTSLSMAYPARAAADDSSSSASEPSTSRSDAVAEVLLDDGLMQSLSQTHNVSLFTFDKILTGPVAVATDENIRFVAPQTDDESTDDKSLPDVSENSSPPNEDVDEADGGRLLQPRGSETRLGEALHQLVGQMSGRTLSGIVVISDGRSNAGLDVESARLRAERTGSRLITVGVGSDKPQINFWVAGMQSPTDVHKGDPFDINVFVQGTGTDNNAVTVKLFQRSAAGSDDERQIAEKNVTLTSDSMPFSVTFTQSQSVPGHYEFVTRVAGAEPVDEITVTDNERRREVEVTDRKVKVLLISSGPMRDYQFVRNTLFRHSGIDSDVWLQTVTDENLGFVSQEATALLTEFPASEAELFKYDVIVAFDPDWGRLTETDRTWLNRWVAQHSGGLIVVAGEIFTPRLAQDKDAWGEVSVLYPVVLNRMLPELQITQRADQPWAVTLTAAGRNSEFLKITDALGNSGTELWETFRGIYRSYPVRSVRDGAVVLLEYSNPRARTEIGQPPFIAEQFYGTGRTMFIGSAELWRLREISPEGYQSLWTSLIREVGQGRRSRGNSRGVLLLDRSEVSPGMPVRIRAQLYDARLQPLQSDAVTVSITDQAGRPITVPDRLRSDGRGTGQFVGTFRPPRGGTYRISVPVPESSDILQASVEVVLPQLESENPARNVSLLVALTEDTNGHYLSLDELAEELPALLPDRSEPIIVEEQLRTLWDRRWLMFVIIALLSVEWGLRRIVKLS
jgi:hypothetical protein